MCVCVCVCVCCHPICSGRQACGRTSRGHTGGSSYKIPPPSFLGACLDFPARRIQPFLSHVDRDIEFCVLTNKSFSTCWAFLFFSFLLFFFFFFWRGKIPVRVTAPRFEPTSQRQKVSRLPAESPGRPVEEELNDVGWLGRLHSLWAAEFSDTKNCSTIWIVEG